MTDNSSTLMAVSLAHLRRDYTQAGLKESDLHRDPIRQFHRWFEQALAAGICEPNAMVLSTVGPAQQPVSRVVLLKKIDPKGFVFFTNYLSRKGREIARQPRASITFAWLELERQVTVLGKVTKAPRAWTEKYFHSRPRGSQLGAWASPQSKEIPDRAWLEARLAILEKQYAGKKVPVPPHWGGYILQPESIEFWQGRPNRLHDRLRYERGRGRTVWSVVRLGP